jgi:sodium transport system permease protein
VKDTLQRHKDKLVEQRLRAGGLDWADLEPFGLETKKAASEQEQALGLLALLIPMLIFNMVMAGGQSVALDATAGEKQMGTLEALLVAPLEPWKLLLGKGLAVFVTALFSSFASVVGLALGSFMVYSGFSPQIRALSAEHVPIGTFALPASSLTLILLTAVLFSAFLVGVVLSLGIFARSYREANTYLIPLELLAFLPMLIFFLSEHLQPQIWHFALPGVGVVFALDGIVKGSAEPGQLALTWLCTLVYTLAALGWAYWSLRREDVIFRN